MSYFGTEGPPQDGGFISGIARGNARLSNAKNTRARYQKGLGAPAVIDTDNWRWVPGMSQYPSDAILYKRTKNFADGYEMAQSNMEMLEDGRISQSDADVVLKQYENDKKLIAQWAESGPYVHETKALALSVVPWLVIAGAYYSYALYSRRPRGRAQGNKSALYAVFS